MTLLKEALVCIYYIMAYNPEFSSRNFAVEIIDKFEIFAILAANVLSDRNVPADVAM